MKPPAADPWSGLRAHTPARIGLARSGSALAKKALLGFRADHATARDAVRAKAVSAVELTRAVLARIDALDPALKAYVSTCPDRALAAAAEVDAGTRAGPLAGVPVAVKDNLCTSFGTTTCSSRMLADFRAPYDAMTLAHLLGTGPAPGAAPDVKTITETPRTRWPGYVRNRPKKKKAPTEQR